MFKCHTIPKVDQLKGLLIQLLLSSSILKTTVVSPPNLNIHLFLIIHVLKCESRVLPFIMKTG